MSSHFSAVFIHNFDWAKELKVLVVQDERYMKHPYDGTYESLWDNGDVKMPGGMGEVVSGDGREETPGETMRREAVSETGVQVLAGEVVRIEKIEDRRSGDLHEKYFFLATQVSGLPALDAPPRRVVETNPRDKSQEKLVCYWLPIRVFAERLYRGQHQAFGAVLGKLASMNTDFFHEYKDLLMQFPEPEDPGIDEGYQHRAG